MSIDGALDDASGALDNDDMIVSLDGGPTISGAVMSALYEGKPEYATAIALVGILQTLHWIHTAIDEIAYPTHGDEP